MEFRPLSLPELRAAFRFANLQLKNYELRIIAHGNAVPLHVRQAVKVRHNYNYEQPMTVSNWFLGTADSSTLLIKMVARRVYTTQARKTHSRRWLIACEN